MTKTILNIKTDPSTKQQIQEFAAELGVPVSVIMNAQIKQMLRDRKIILSTELEPTPYLEKIMEQVEEDLKTGRNITRTSSKKEALSHLRSL
jgi:antitoxin component of RelBE/YafQ-DinJ toxin-antitoxin module